MLKRERKTVQGTAQKTDLTRVTVSDQHVMMLLNRNVKSRVTHT